MGLSDPVGTAIANSTGVGTIAADAMPALSITDAVPVAEGGEATFMVSLSPASSELVTVAYATQDGTAVADSDYTATSGTLRFEPGETIQNIQVATLRVGDGRDATQDGTAVADSDYTATSGTLRFEPGETIQNIQVATLRDAIAEPSESFTGAE